jgi:hypothetical protein
VDALAEPGFAIGDHQARVQASPSTPDGSGETPGSASKSVGLITACRTPAALLVAAVAIVLGYSRGGETAVLPSQALTCRLRRPARLCLWRMKPSPFGSWNLWIGLNEAWIRS